jgi:ATP adenylyltransferase
MRLSPKDSPASPAQDGFRKCDTTNSITGCPGFCTVRLISTSLLELPGTQMDYLWSPWRMKYIENHESQQGCLFCNALAQEDSPENLIILRGRRAFTILNLYPYTSGHLMVAPMSHKASLELLDPETRAEMMEQVSQAIVVLKLVYNPQAFNVGANIGEPAGAGEPGHVHMHVVPRWTGDTNFMSTLAATRVLPEALEDTYRRIKEGFLRH